MRSQESSGWAMKNKQDVRFYNWLGAMAALLIAIVIGWSWRNTLIGIDSPPKENEIQQEEALPDDEAEEVEFEISSSELEGEDFGSVQLGVDANLNELYEAQHLFRGENGHFTTDLIAIGWAPSSVLMDYKLGFLVYSVPIDVDEIPTRASTDEYLNINENETDAPFLYSPDAQLINLDRYQFLCRNGCSAGSDHFEIMIAVPLDNTGNADIWLFDDQKRLIHVWDGIRGQQLQ